MEILPYNKYNDLSDRTYDDIDTADKNIKKMAELLSFNYKRQISEKQRKILVERLRKARFIHNIFTKMRLNGVEEIILSL